MVDPYTAVATNNFLRSDTGYCSRRLLTPQNDHEMSDRDADEKQKAPPLQPESIQAPSESFVLLCVYS